MLLTNSNGDVVMTSQCWVSESVQMHSGLPGTCYWQTVTAMSWWHHSAACHRVYKCIQVFLVHVMNKLFQIKQAVFLCVIEFMTHWSTPLHECAAAAETSGSLCQLSAMTKMLRGTHVECRPLSGSEKATAHPSSDALQQLSLTAECYSYLADTTCRLWPEWRSASRRDSESGCWNLTVPGPLALDWNVVGRDWNKQINVIDTMWLASCYTIHLS